MIHRLAFVTTAALVAASCLSLNVCGQSFVNWESPHVHPMDLAHNGDNGSLLLAVNTADNRLEVFAVDSKSGSFAHIGSVPVGLDPVSVRARTATEAWVVNHISDSISIVDLQSMNVIATLATGDEPCDVVFAGSPGNERAFVSVSQLNQVKVFDPADLVAPPIVIDIEGEDPRALATNGTTVYAAIFESGNNTTILAQEVVSSAVNPYPVDANPPPNDGAAFNPPINPDNPTAPEVSLIVRKQSDNTWRDDNDGNWTPAVTWDLHDHDVAVIDADSLNIIYVTGLMNLNMHLAVNPASGDVSIIGTDAINDVRFEPNVAGIFVRVVGATISGGVAGAPSAVDLNPHLDYSSPTIDQTSRDLSIGDPRAIVWNSTGDVGYIAGMGSNNIIAVDASFNRIGLIEVDQGPTGLVLDDANDILSVLNKFDATISIIDTLSLSVIETLPLFDPTPAVIKTGRPHLYDTHATSGLGQASCASCHVDGRMDQIAWDLGDPSGEVQTFNQTCNFGLGGCEDWHPMKGPMATQSLIAIIDTEPFHWRGDRTGLAAFNPAFINLMGDDAMLTPEQMDQFEAFVATLEYPPNPNRNINNTLKTSLQTSTGLGNPVSGSNLFNTAGLDLVNCVTCHAMPSGTNSQLTSGDLLQQTQSIKIPQLRNMHEKTGFLQTSQNNNRGFGFIHDGSVDTLFNFLLFPGFQFAGGQTGIQQRRDVEAFLLSFSIDTHAGVGTQTTATSGGNSPDNSALINQMINLANGNTVGLVVKGKLDGEQRGWMLAGAQFQSDRAADVISTAALLALSSPGSELTYTLVPAGSQTRIGVDRDEDGYFDGDELDAGSDPADAGSTPKNVCLADMTGDDVVGPADLAELLAQWGACAPEDLCPADLTGDNIVGPADLAELLAQWGKCP